MSHYPPQQPWGSPLGQPGQWGQPTQPSASSPSWQPQPGQYNQPVQQGWPGSQAVQPSLRRTQQRRAGKAPKSSKPKKPLTKRDYVIGCGIMVLLLACSVCGISALAKSASGPTATPTVQAVIATATTASSAALATQKPTAKTTPKPTPRPTPKTTQPPMRPTPKPTQHTGVNGNPWGYDFNAGHLIYSPNSAFCNYFACVSTFWVDTNGYVAECANGSYTHSGGVRGACSRDGGVLRPLYSH